MTNKAILRMQKIKTFGELAARSKHNTRDTETGLEHTTPDEKPIIIMGERDALKSWKDKAAKRGIDPKKLPKNNVPAVEFVASVSPQWWKITTPEMQAEWMNKTLSFISEEIGGKDNILQAVMHLDETTPHLQIIAAPFVRKQQKARGRGSAGKPPKTVQTCSVSHYFGGHKDRLSQLQTSYGKEVEELGIHRGTPKKETGARNMNPATWRAENAKALDKLTSAYDLAEKAKKDALRMYAEAEARLNEAREIHSQMCKYRDVVRADAHLIGKAIHFPAYEQDPNNAAAREAVQKAAQQRTQDKAAQEGHNARQRTPSALRPPAQPQKVAQR